MTRLAGITSLYALIAALLLVTPLSASQDPVPETVAPTEESEQPPDPVAEATEPPPTEPPAPPPAEPAPPPEPVPPAEPAPLPPSSPAPGTAVIEAPAPEARSKPKPRRAGDAPRAAAAAADTGVTVSDFQFAPSSVTIDVGDTVTWTNDGPTPHSATADDGSFDTGIFAAGQSRSQTFDQAGTFAYFCTPHPNMRGTIEVRAGSTGGNGSGGGPGSTGGDSGTSGGDSGSAASGTAGDSGTGLPATGLDAGGLALLGLVTLALGAFLRRRARFAG